MSQFADDAVMVELYGELNVGALGLAVKMIVERIECVKIWMYVMLESLV